MSRRTGESPAEENVGIDFILRTMIEREKSGKRKIRPKRIEEDLLGDDSDDSDFNLDHQKKKDNYDSDSEISDVEKSPRYDEDGDTLSERDSSSDNSSEEELEDSSDSDSQTPVKKSTLKEALDKLNESSPIKPKRKKKRKPKKPPGGDDTKKPATSKKRKTDAARRKRAPNGGKGKKPPEVFKKSKKKKKKDGDSIADLINGVSFHMAESRLGVDLILAKKICSACLGEHADELNNEIVECDSCGVSVHEACYGVSDAASVSSGSGSSCSTEPWFCDPCKYEAPQLFCELCPVKGGLFKETVHGRWIHVVCALYTPGVQIDIDGTPQLKEVKATKWGSQVCNICEDEREARTGVCIRCDAGFCKTFQHATCAQKSGLLSDPTPHEAHETQAVADPYYASCKHHTRKEDAKRRARNYLVLQEQLRLKAEKKKTGIKTEEEKKAQNRIQKKLIKIRARVESKALLQMSVTQPPLPPISLLNDSKPTSAGSSVTTAVSQPIQTIEQLKRSRCRFLHTAPGPSALMLEKLEALGLDRKAEELEERNEQIVTNVKKKWNVPVSLSVTFVAYYGDRERRISNFADQLSNIDKANSSLVEKASELKNLYDGNVLTSIDIETANRQIEKDIEELKGILKMFGPNALTKSPSKVKSPRRSNSNNFPTSPVIKVEKKFSLENSGILSKKRKHIQTTRINTGRVAIAKCDVCCKSDKQHMITYCDNCEKHYHLHCLDPPLTRMPRVSRSCGWMCSNCGDAETSPDEEVKVDIEAPRTLRGRTNLRKPGKYRSIDGMKMESMSPESKTIASVSGMFDFSPPPSPIPSPVKIKIENISPENFTENSPSKMNGRSSGTPPTPQKKIQKKRAKKSPKAPQTSKNSEILSMDLLNSPNLTETSTPNGLTSTQTPPKKTRKRKSNSPTPKTRKPKGSKTSPMVISSQIPESEILPPPPKKRKRSGKAKEQIENKTTELLVDVCNVYQEPWKSPSSESKKGKKKTEELLPISTGTPNGNNGRVSPSLLSMLSPLGNTNGKCGTCDKEDNQRNLVKCDKCELEFHFQCLVPPLKYTPKRRGYSWYCSSCDETSSLDSVQENEL